MGDPAKKTKRAAEAPTTVPAKALPALEPSKLLVTLNVEDMRRIVREELDARGIAARPANDVVAAPLSTRKAAEFLGINAKTLSNLVLSGQIKADFPKRKGFKSHRFLLSTLQEYAHRKE